MENVGAPTITVGSKVRERYVPSGCRAWTGTVDFVAPDGWLIVLMNNESGAPREGFLSRLSYPPYEVEGGV